MQPTLPGVEEAVTPSVQGSEIPADPPSGDGEMVEAVAMEVDTSPATASPGRTADSPMCMQCGVSMMRAGSCHVCPSCGSTSGCS